MRLSKRKISFPKPAWKQIPRQFFLSNPGNSAMTTGKRVICSRRQELSQEAQPGGRSHKSGLCTKPCFMVLTMV